MRTLKVFIVVGARPNFMKAAAVIKQLKKHEKFYPILVHTGQHYDDDMSESFFDDLRLPKPDIYLGIGSGTHAEQTGKIMIEFEKVCFELKPDLVVVVGDVNSTMACALVAAKLFIPVAHVEAGLRSFDRTMPEEINRILTDQISDYLFTTSEDANENLIKEGITESKIFFVGNVMIDTLMKHIELSQKSEILENFGLRKNGSIKKYAVLTLHRPSNVDNHEILEGIFTALNKLSKKIPIIFPAHPRTVKKIKDFMLEDLMHFLDNTSSYEFDDVEPKVFATLPMGYLDFICLMSNSSLILTDSGGIQEETTILGIPCLTLRENTERPVTVKEGTNIIVGNNPENIVRSAENVLENGMLRKKAPKFWDGKAADRIIEVLSASFK